MELSFVLFLLYTIIHPRLFKQAIPHSIKDIVNDGGYINANPKPIKLDTLEASWKSLSKSSRSFSLNSTALNAMIILDNRTLTALVYIKEPIAYTHTLNHIDMRNANVIPLMSSNNDR